MILEKKLTRRIPFMIRLLGLFVFCIALQGTLFAKEEASLDRSCVKGPAGPKGPTGPTGDPGPDFGQFACLYSTAEQILSAGQYVLFPNEISLAGITYDNSSGVLTLEPGLYSVTYFSEPVNNLFLVANGGTIPNSPLGGSASLLNLSNGTNTIVLQATGNVTLSAASENQCNAMITVYRIN